MKRYKKYSIKKSSIEDKHTLIVLEDKQGQGFSYVNRGIKHPERSVSLLY